MLLGEGLEDVETDLLPDRWELDRAVEALDAKIAAFGREVFEAFRADYAAPTGWQTEWNGFIARWKAWQPKGYFLVHTRRSEYLGFAREFNELLGRWQKLPAAPESTVAPKSIPKGAGEGLLDKAGRAAEELAKGIGGTVRTLLYIGAGAAALYFLAPAIVKTARNPRRRRRRLLGGRRAAYPVRR